MRHVALLVVAVSCVLFPGLSACGSLREHGQGEIWRGAFEQTTADPWQWAPAAATLAATPILLFDDKHTSAESVEDHFFGTKTSYGDELSLGLGLAPILLGGAHWVAAGDSEVFEAASEATVAVAAETQVLKLVTNRQRPDGSSGSASFPSGHTSFAFGGATLLARWWEREHDGSKLLYWLYVPASYVGLTRLEGDRHYLSDITFGAALGILTSNLVWNAHFGDERHAGLYSRRRALSTLTPLVTPEGVGLAWSLSF